MLKTDDLNTAYLKSEDSKLAYMCWVPYYASLSPRCWDARKFKQSKECQVSAVENFSHDHHLSDPKSST